MRKAFPTGSPMTPLLTICGEACVRSPTARVKRNSKRFGPGIAFCSGNAARAAIALVMLLAMPWSRATAAPQSESTSASHPKGATEQPVMGKHLEAPGLRDFGQVTPTLYRGGQPSPQGFQTLVGMGIKIIVDTGRSKRDEALVKKLGMRYVSLPWYCPFPKDNVFDRFIELIRNNPGKKIFVHCRLGDDRTGMMIAAYRMAADGWTAKQAMQEMREFGYTPIHHLMCPGLARYEHSFPHRLQDDAAFDNLR
jgi:tyrosine-protein phosphatase SIW14